MESKIVHLMYCPWTGLGLYNGFRGNRWLKNRIQIFKQFVIPSLLNQTNKNFILWCSWRREEKNNPLVLRFVEELKKIKEFKVCHTFHGLCFYDDKYEDKIARGRLLTNLHNSLGELVNIVGECEYVFMTIQPSDDVYHKNAVEGIQRVLSEIKEAEAFGFRNGYIIDYKTKEIAEWNPATNPPFYTIKFTREVFTDARKHVEYASLKSDIGNYQKGTPCPSHEYIGHCVKYVTIKERGFMVGVHGENVSTTFNHPFRGATLEEKEKEGVLKAFGLFDAPKLEVPFSLRRFLFNKLPYNIQRKLRYWAGEKRWALRPIFGFIYNILRS